VSILTYSRRYYCLLGARRGKASPSTGYRCLYQCHYSTTYLCIVMARLIRVSQLLSADPSRSMLTAVIILASNLIISRPHISGTYKIPRWYRTILPGQPVHVTSSSNGPKKDKKKFCPGSASSQHFALSDPCPKSDSNGLPTQRYDSTVADAPLAQGNTEDATILMD